MAWSGAVDTDGEPCDVRRFFHCDDCHISWEDDWSCACNDHCPGCDAEYEPLDWCEVDEQGNVIK